MYHSFMWREKEEKNQKLSHHRYNQKSLKYRKLCYLLLTLLLLTFGMHKQKIEI